MKAKAHRYMSAMERFEAQCIPVPEAGCWIWIGAEVEGYGQIGVDGGRMPAHRFSLTIKLGRPIAPGMLSCHKCDTPLCVNPDHLYEGTLVDNAQDCVRRGRKLRGAALSARLVNRCHGTAHHANKLSENDVRAIRSSQDGAKETGTAYGIAANTVRKIRSGKTWKRLT